MDHRTIVSFFTCQLVWVNRYSYCMVEHIFYGRPGTEDYFLLENVPGGKLIKFQGSKTKFAEDVIPTLPQESFETFRPMFDWIRAQCA